MAKSKKLNDYQKYLKAASNNCKNPTKTNKERLKKARERYIKGALEKGKSKTEVNKIRAKVERCKR